MEEKTYNPTYRQQLAKLRSRGMGIKEGGLKEALCNDEFARAWKIIIML